MPSGFVVSLEDERGQRRQENRSGYVAIGVRTRGES
jgi:hypothetical protein